MKDGPDGSVLQGTLDLLILRVLKREPLHGWGIADRIKQHSQQALSIGEGSLYPALYRLEERGWISADWGVSDNNRKAKFYRLTKAGRKQIERDTRQWEATSAIMMRFLTRNED
jgi:PadR family transcriptional regulator PadR